jgi:hypothetical protein
MSKESGFNGYGTMITLFCKGSLSYAMIFATSLHHMRIDLSSVSRHENRL